MYHLKPMAFITALLILSFNARASFIVEIYDTNRSFHHTDQLRSYVDTNSPTSTHQYNVINFSDWGVKGFFGNENLWPVAHTETFAAHITGQFEIAQSGLYDFASWSDDGFQLLIDGVETIINPGPHAPTLNTGSMNLSAGFHNVEMFWYENFGAAVLETSIKQSGASDWQLLTAASPPTASNQAVPEAPLIVMMALSVFGMAYLRRNNNSVSLSNSVH